MIILNSKEDAYDAEMLLYTMTLINKVCSSDLDSDSPTCSRLVRCFPSGSTHESN